MTFVEEDSVKLCRARPASSNLARPAHLGISQAPTSAARITPTREYGLVALIVLLGLGLRAWGLEGQSLTMDEVTELHIAERAIEEIVWLADGFPPLYHILLHGWREWFPSESSARWLSVVLGCLSVLAIWRLARQWGGARVGLWTALLLALSPFHIWYSQEARAYGLYFLLGILALWFFARASKTNRYADWALYSLVSLAGVYTHYYFAVLLLINAVLLIVEKRSWRDRTPALLTHAGLALLSAPSLWLMRSDLSLQAGFDLYAPFNVASVGYTYFTFIAGFSLGPSMRELHATSAAETIVQALPWLLAVGLVVTVLGYQASKVFGGWSAVARLAIIAMAPVLVSGILAVFLGVGYRVRYVVWAAIPLFIVLGAGLSRPGFRRSVAAAVLAIAVVFSVSLFNRHNVDRYRNEDMRGVSAYLKSVATPGTPVFVISGYMARPVRYYLGENWFVCAIRRVEPRGGDPGEALRVIEANAPPASPFWLVYTRPFHGDPRGEVRDMMLRRGLIRQRAQFAGIVLYEGITARPGPAGSLSRAGVARGSSGCAELPEFSAATE